MRTPTILKMTQQCNNTQILVNVFELETVYFKNEELKLSNMIVVEKKANRQIILDVVEYSLKTNFNNQVEGRYWVKISVKSMLYVFDVIVIEKILSINNNETEINIGTTHFIKHIREGILYLKKSNLPREITKNIYISKGVYIEKLIIDIPNVILYGEDIDDTVISFSAAHGDLKLSGEKYGTFGSSTLSIDSEGTGFMATNLTIKNSFDYSNSMLKDRQAVAFLNEADMVILTNVKLLGYQDTLYAKNGRQYYLDVYIEGMIDYIFGFAGPIFIEKSTIKSLNMNKEVIISVNKGYKDQEDMLIKYGFVFYNNKFLFEDGIPKESVFLGRPWGKNASIYYIKNSFGDYIHRNGWTNMSENLPENARFFEFENFNDNEILPTTTHGQALSSLEVEIVLSKDVIFSRMNGDIDFLVEWDYKTQLQRLIKNIK